MKERRGLAKSLSQVKTPGLRRASPANHWTLLFVLLSLIGLAGLTLVGCKPATREQEPTKGDIYVYVASPLLVSDAEGSLLTAVYSISAFFVIHGIIVTAERILFTKKTARSSIGSTLITILTLLFVIATSSLFFYTTDRIFALLFQ